MREKLTQLDYPIIPYLGYINLFCWLISSGMYLQDLASIKEQMPDTIEPGSFINFAKRQKLSSLITDIYHYHQQGFCLEPVPFIQDFLKQLDIYEISEMKAISEQYQEIDGDKNITEDIFETIQMRPPAAQPAVKAVQQPGLQRVGSKGPSQAPTSASAQPNKQSPSASPGMMFVLPTSHAGDSPRSSQNLSVGNLSRASSATSFNGNNASPRSSPHSSQSRGNDPLGTLYICGNSLDFQTQQEPGQ